MYNVTTVNNMRRSDAATIAAGTPGRVLMYRAAQGIYDAVEWASPIAIICGKGNNAGDGYALAQILDEKGYDVTVVRLFDETSLDGAFYLDGCLKKNIKVKRYAEVDNFPEFRIFVDCVLGTGFSGDVGSPLKEIFARLNASFAYTVSVDINSGLSGDTGMGTDFLYSDLTVSIGSFKTGHFIGKGRFAAKERANVDIGIALIDEPYGVFDEDERYRLGPVDCDVILPYKDGYIVRIMSDVFFHHDREMLTKLLALSKEN